MTIETTRFGLIPVDDACVITFPEGLPGFEGCRRFTLVPHPGPQGRCDSPFEWLQSVDDGSLAFLTMDPRLAFPQYDPHLPSAELEAVSLERVDREGARLYALLTVPKGDPAGITANLLAPLVVNEYARLGKQIVASGENYGLRHRLVPN
jgi:flagellar assembly factor FliW